MTAMTSIPGAHDLIMADSRPIQATPWLTTGLLMLLGRE
jgi:hypothetical protein